MTITTNKDLADPEHLLFVNLLDSTPIPPETVIPMIVDHLVNNMGTVSSDPSPISPLLEQPGRRYGVRRSKTRTLRKIAALNERRSCRSSLRTQ